MTIKPLTFFVVAVAGWMNRHQQEVISYLREEIAPGASSG